MNVACSICLESFTLTSDIYSTPCGHVFHCYCIQKWLKRGNQYCTHCRQNCTINEITRLHFSENKSALEENYVATKLESKNQKLLQEVNALKARALEANKKCNQLELENVKLQQKRRSGASKPAIYRTKLNRNSKKMRNQNALLIV